MEAADQQTGTGETRAQRERILAAARRVFLDGPPEQATMDAVAQAAGMAKKTIYRQFKSQLDLLIALLADVAADFEGAPPPSAASDLELELRTLLERLVTHITSSRSSALVRLIISEVRRYPELLTHRPKSNYAVEAIARWLSAPAVTARHDFGDPVESASMLLGMVMQDAAFKLLLPASEAIPPHIIAERAQKAAAIFLRGTAR